MITTISFICICLCIIGIKNTERRIKEWKYELAEKRALQLIGKRKVKQIPERLRFSMRLFNLMLILSILIFLSSLLINS